MRADRAGKSFSRFVQAVAFPAFIIVILVVVWVFRSDLTTVFSSPERVQQWVREIGFAGPLVFVALQIVQVIVFVIPGEIVQIAGGYLFGITLGVVYSLIGITIGAAFNFYIARWLGIPFVEAVFPRRQVARFRAVAESPRAKIGLFLFFLIPGIPKDILCYVAGIAPITFRAFLAISVAGRLPALVGSNLIGDAAAAKQWNLAITIFALAVLLFLLGFAFRSQLHGLIERITGGSRSRHDDDEEEG
jgi:uncharacterized membrane protein YdjX (TVP38/TMEM64 family)